MKIFGKEGDLDELLNSDPDALQFGVLEDAKEREDEPQLLEKSPFAAWMFEPFIYEAVSKTPNISSKTIRGMLQEYAIELFIMENLIQNTRTTIRNKVFGNPGENIFYLPALAVCLEECEHSFHVVKKTPFAVKKRLLNIIPQEKIKALANATPPKQMSAIQKLEYVDAWQVE